MKEILLSWSGGKDSAWALHVLRRAGEFEVGALVTTVNERFGRVAIHGFREELLVRQAEAAGVPLWTVDLPFPCTNAEYEERMGTVYARAVREGFLGVAFGDLYLEEVRAYRLRTLLGTGLEAVFPVWGMPTVQLAGEMLAAGVQARLTCVDPRRIPAEWAGRPWDAGLVEEIGGMAGVDVCGENGEFHTFCWAGPMFAREVRVEAGERVERDGFCYAEMVELGGTPAEEAAGVAGTVEDGVDGLAARARAGRRSGRARRGRSGRAGG